MGRGAAQAEFIDPRDLRPRSTLDDLVSAYLQDLADKGRSTRTVPAYARYLRGFLEFVQEGGSTARVQDLDVRLLRAYSTRLSRRQAVVGRRPGGRPIAAATRNLHLIALRGLLRYAQTLDLPVPAPEKVELAKAREPSPDARHLERPRLDRLLAAPVLERPEGLRTRALLELLCATGCRISEVVALDRKHVELDASAAAPDGIRVLDEVLVLGKGGRHRRVYLTTRAREWIARYLEKRHDKDPALFVTRRRKEGGSLRMSVWMGQRSIADAAKRAGLAENVSPHWLRHAAITQWTTEMGLPAAQRLAGHKHIASTNRYLGGSDAELKELYKRRIG